MRIDTRRAYIISAIAAFIVLLVITLICCNKESIIIVVYSQEFFAKYDCSFENEKCLFGYVLFGRLKLYCLWWLLGKVERCQKAYLLALSALGACLGLVLGALLINFGFVGIVVFVMLLVPHGLLYACGLFLICNFLKAYQMLINDKIKICMYIILTLILGCLLETFITTWIVRSLLK